MERGLEQGSGFASRVAVLRGFHIPRHWSAGSGSERGHHCKHPCASLGPLEHAEQDRHLTDQLAALAPVVPEPHSIASTSQLNAACD